MPQARRALLRLLTMALLAVAGQGCATWQPGPPGVTPQPPYTPYPGPPQTFWEHRTVTLRPERIVAPVNADVVVVGGVCGFDGHLVVDQKIEWTLDTAGVGHIVDFEQRPAWKWLLGPFRYPRKLGNDYAIGMTSDTFWRLTRGTPICEDDVLIRRGETWVVVSSPVEGRTFITATSPDVNGWNERRKQTVIHWIDAEWGLPPASQGSMGAAVNMTTNVLRHSDKTPLSGWLVRYTLSGGVPAAFAPDGSQSIDVRTDATGNAVAQLMQPQPERGVSNVTVQVFQPAELSDDGRPLLIAEATTSHTWASAELTVGISATPQTTPGGTIQYAIDIVNRGEAPARNVSVVDELPEGVTFLDSSPEARGSLRRLTWMFDEIAPQAAQQIVINVRADRAGDVSNCVAVSAAEGLAAQNCATTRVGGSVELDVELIAPATANIGEDVLYEIRLANRGTAPATGLGLRATFDPGLSHETTATGPLERELQDLAAGEQRSIHLQLRASRSGRLCLMLDVTRPNTQAVTRRACVDVAPAASPSLPADEPRFPTTPSTPAGQAALSVRKQGPMARNVDDTAQFEIIVTNTGTATAYNVRVVDTYDLALSPVRASEGFRDENGSLVYTIAQLAPGRSESLAVECRCTRESGRACNRVSVTADGLAAVQGEACLAIGPSAAAAGVTVAVSDQRDPVEVGQQFTYNVYLENNTVRDVAGLTLTLNVPANLTAVPLGTHGPSRFEIDGQTVRFRNMPAIKPGETVRAQLRVRAKAAGQAVVRAELSGAALPSPVTASESTDLINGK